MIEKNWREIHLKKNSVDVSLLMDKELASVEEMFAYQVHRMTHFVDSLFPLPLTNCPRNKIIIVPVMEIIHENNNMDSHSPELNRQ